MVQSTSSTASNKTLDAQSKPSAHLLEKFLGIYAIARGLLYGKMKPTTT